MGWTRFTAKPYYGFPLVCVTEPQHRTAVPTTIRNQLQNARNESAESRAWTRRTIMKPKNKTTRKKNMARNAWLAK